MAINNSFDLTKLIRPNIAELMPYASARDEFQGEASVYLDANENSLGSVTPETFNRYPDPLQLKLKTRLAKIKNLQPDQIFLGNGSDEAIDLLYRAFCEPRIDRALIFPPTYGMYKVQAGIHNTPVDELVLNDDFSLPVDKISQIINPNIKLLFICSPNNPTGNLIDKNTIIRVLNCFKGLVIVDEAYIDFADKGSMVSEINNYPNLVVLQTFSKAWGMAGLRLGMAFAQQPTISVLNKIKYPYNVNSYTQAAAIEAIQNETLKNQMVTQILEQRQILQTQLPIVKGVQQVYPSDSNFLLVKISDASQIYRMLIEKGIVVRNRSTVALCNNCLRITVGTADENRLLLEQLQQITKSINSQILV